MDVGSSDLVVGSLRQHVGEVSLNTLIFLMSPLSIRHDEVPTSISTIFSIFIKPSEVVKHSLPLFNHRSSWKDKFIIAVWVRAHAFRIDARQL